MANQNKQNRCPHCNAELPSPNSSKIAQPPSPAQRKLLNYVDRLDGPDRIKALKLVHDIVV